jgi:hypothetical protein
MGLEELDSLVPPFCDSDDRHRLLTANDRWIGGAFRFGEKLMYRGHKTWDNLRVINLRTM